MEFSMPLTKYVFTSIIALSISGCAGPSPSRYSQPLTEKYTTHNLNAAERAAKVTCPDELTCKKAFELTKSYVHENSNMRVNHSDEMMISTFGSIGGDKVSLSASMTPDVGTTKVIKLKGYCRNMELYPPACIIRLQPIYEGFKPFVESKLP